MLDKQSKNQRILSIYVRLCEGKTIHKAAEADSLRRCEIYPKRYR